jgi:AcrR family transcriptional regulator
MSANRKRRGISRADWLEAALEVLRDRGIAGISVEGLARSLGISKAGFYWHFKDRDDLFRQLLDFWSHEMTEVLSNNPQVIELEPKERLVRIAEVIARYDLTRYEIPIRQWALQDPEVARAVRRVNRARMETVRHAFAELGFAGKDLEMRTMLFTGYHTAESSMFPEVSRKRCKEQIAARIDLLTSR